MVAQTASGFVSAPSALAAICSITAASNESAGGIFVYKVIIRAGYNSGSPGASESAAAGGNMGFYMDSGGGPVLQSRLCVPPVSGPTSLTPIEFTVALFDGEVLSVNAIANATAGVVYNAYMILTPATVPGIA